MTKKQEVHYICSKEAEISEIHTILVRVDKALNGNGRPGMIEEWNLYKGYTKAIIKIGSVISVALSLAIATITCLMLFR